MNGVKKQCRCRCRREEGRRATLCGEIVVHATLEIAFVLKNQEHVPLRDVCYFTLKRALWAMNSPVKGKYGS